MAATKQADAGRAQPSDDRVLVDRVESAAAPLESPIRALRINQEVLLHAAMYRAAFDSNVSDGAKHFLLQPVEEDDPPELGAEPEEFRRRVLDELKTLGVEIAWAVSTWRTRGQEMFPGADVPATRLTIKIIDRNQDQATVAGEIGDQTPGVASSRQGVTATWDGAKWHIERDRVRAVW